MNKQLSNPFSTGGGGAHFEAHVLASFVVLMLSGGYAPCLPCWPIVKIKPQGKVDGFDTDDLIVFVERGDTREQRKLLGQIKHAPAFTKGDKELPEVFQAAWNDFNNPRVFKQSKDIIALITGPLSRTDFHNVHWLLNQARHTVNADEFYRHVERAKFSPSKAEEKLAVIQHHLQQANNNKDLSQDELYLFLKHFHLLGYDLGDEVGVVLSLLHSHISQFNQQTPQWIWSRAVDLVQTWNKDAGTITPENLPEDFRDAFKRPVIAHIPPELIKPHFDIAKTDWQQHKYAADLALLLLLGAWNEKNKADVSIVTNLTGQEYAVLAPKIQELLQAADSPLSLHNGIWKLSERIGLWEQIGSRIFDQHLETFKECAVSVLTERDPAFELPKDKRFMASIYEKTPQWSPILKKGLAEGLALLGSHPKMLNNCSDSKVDATVVLAVRAIFTDADWILWGSLNNLLPVLAEAAPDEFLKAVENALRLSPCPFDELFAQEDSGGFGGANYMTGLLWALEALAWDGVYLIRVCVLLGELASRDPGGTWSNRPDNSLITILLPLYPQTFAPIEKRKNSIKTLCDEIPEVGWKLVLALLHNKRQMTSGSYKPVWRNPVHDNWKPEVTAQEYQEQVSFYSDMAVSLAENDLSKLTDLSDYLYSISESSLARLLAILSSESILNHPEQERLQLWNTLVEFIVYHRQVADGQSSSENELILSVEKVIEKLAPSDPLNMYQRLFCRDELDLYEELENLDIQREKVAKRRRQAIKEILNSGGIYSVIQFSDFVEDHFTVGVILADLTDIEIDTILLPKYLKKPEGDMWLSFIVGYIRHRCFNKGWPWVDSLNKSDWNSRQLCEFLCFLPFTNETWERAEAWLKDGEKEYWQTADANPYRDSHIKSRLLNIAVDKLVEYGRPYAAIRCLHLILHEKKEIDTAQCVRVLLAAVSSSEPHNLFEPYDVTELIKVLQEDKQISKDDLLKVEWAYLPILDGRRHHDKVCPKLLENRLANEPEFFCEVIKLVYRSKNPNIPDRKFSEQERNIARNARQLLHNWHFPPGMQEDGSFDGANFSDWPERVKKICVESGHIDVAQSLIGTILVYCPSDTSGLWINKAVAAALNAQDANEMRTGFRVGLFNSRNNGKMHKIDPTGKPERELAEKYRQHAEDVENSGYHRLAVTLRDLAKSYDREAERNIAEYALEQKQRNF